MDIRVLKYFLAVAREGKHNKGGAGTSHDSAAVIEAA